MGREEYEPLLLASRQVLGSSAIARYNVVLRKTQGETVPLVRPQWLTRVVEGTVDLLYPSACLACNVEIADIPDRIGYCLDCRAEMQRGDWPVCSRCASRVPKLPGAVAECGSCRGKKLWFDHALALGDYDSLLREQCLAMKTDRSERIAHSLGQLISKRLANEIASAAPDVIVPVPMHFWRRIARGTNSPAALASAFARELRIPAYPRLLYRQRNTQPQIGLSNPARFRNVRGELQVSTSYNFEAPHVLLVDDILTTGATCSEAARVLKRAGAAKVTVLVAARTLSF